MADAIVLDSSAILAGLYGEPGSAAVLKILADEDADVSISAVNLCEVVTKLAQAGASAPEIAQSLEPLLRRTVDFGSAQVVGAGELARGTKTLGLSLGDRACLGLAISLGATAWTTDTIWKRVAGVRVRLLRG